MEHVATEDFGKDHWTTLSYVETLCVDSMVNKGVGTIDKRRMRTNEKTHPLNAVNLPVGKWAPEYGTRLSGYWDSMGKVVPTRTLWFHDDWDCLNDLEAAGFLEVISEANGYVKMTDRGMKVAGELRAYKAKGGMFSGFRWAEPAAVKA